MHSVREYVDSVTSDKVAIEAREKLFKNILRQEVGFFDKTKSDKILRGLWSDEITSVWSTVDSILSSVFEMGKPQKIIVIDDKISEGMDFCTVNILCEK